MLIFCCCRTGGHPAGASPSSEMAAPVQTTVVTVGGRTGVWGHGLCGCFDDLGICIIAYFVPCVTFGQTAEGLGKSCILYAFLYLFWPCNWFLETRQRGEIRDIRGIPGSGFGDCCLVCWCPFCTLVQEAQEVKDMKQPSGPVTVVTTTTTATQQVAPQQQGQEMVRAWSVTEFMGVTTLWRSSYGTALTFEVLRTLAERLRGKKRSSTLKATLQHEVGKTKQVTLLKKIWDQSAMGKFRSWCVAFVHHDYVWELLAAYFSLWIVTGRSERPKKWYRSFLWTFNFFSWYSVLFLCVHNIWTFFLAHNLLSFLVIFFLM